jgi:nitroreductase
VSVATAPGRELLSLLAASRSIRRYADRPVPDELVLDAVATAQRAPSASGHQPYSVSWVRDPGLRAELEDAMTVQEYVRAAPLFLLIYVDWSRQDRIAEQLLGGTSMNRTSRQVVGMIDATVFTHHLELALAAQGLGTCLAANPLLAMADVARILGLPRHSCLPLHVLVAGYPGEAPPPRPRYPLDMVLHTDRRPAEPSPADVAAYLAEGDATLRAEDYFVVTGDPVASWYDHYRIKYGAHALRRTWQPLDAELPRFLEAGDAP